ncbi:unnamed protein product, partial [Rotaria magnacalcarata]
MKELFVFVILGQDRYGVLGQDRDGVFDCFKLFQLWKSRVALALTLCCRAR